MSELVENAQELLINNKLKDFGYLLNEQWKLKKSMSNIITNSRIDEIYNKGLRAGALGGKTSRCWWRWIYAIFYRS